MHTLKAKLYFVVASYFRFCAAIRLKKWNPRVVVITGSNGKTTLLHLVESQLQTKAFYGFKANSAFGVPFNILGIDRTSFAKIEWISLLLKAPFAVFKTPPKQDTYIVEADVDRPNEGKFLAELLKPEITLWVSSDRTHASQFPDTKDVQDLIAAEYGFFVEHTQKLVIIKDQKNMIEQLQRTGAAHKKVSLDQLEEYSVSKEKTSFETKKGNKYATSFALPKVVFTQIGMTHMLCKVLGETFDPNFKQLTLPPGRSTLLKGKNKVSIFDSSYNSNFASMAASLETFVAIPGKKKWVVIGDMLEQGGGEKAEHERLGDLIASYKFDHIILMGPRVKKYTKPVLRKHFGDKVDIVAFENPKPTLEYLQQELKGGEFIFFKGARYLEGIIEQLLENPQDVDLLCRREDHYDRTRARWGV